MDESGEGGIEFLEFYWRAFFETHPTNSKLKQLKEMKETWMKGGYFTTLLDKDLSVISLDTLYFDSDNDQQDKQEQADQLLWMSKLLKNPPTKNHKWIITSHIYETAKFNGADNEEHQGFDANWYQNGVQAEYYKLMYEHRDDILFTIAGHDHLSDIRSHSGKLFSREDQCYINNGQEEEAWLGKLITPSFTAQQWQNPGWATFNYDSKAKQLVDPKFTFLQLDPTIGQSIYYEDFEYFEADLGDLFGLDTLSSQSVADFQKRLRTSHRLAKKWMNVRRGFSTYNDLCLYGDTEKWGYAPVGTSIDEIFTSLDTGLLQYYCLAMNNMFVEETTACMDTKLTIPDCQ